MINDGQLLVVEEGINELIGVVWQVGQLQVMQDVEFVILNIDVMLILVVMLFKVNYELDLSVVDVVIEQIGCVVVKKVMVYIIVLCSIVQLGIIEDCIQLILEKVVGCKVGDWFLLVFNFEFLCEGFFVKDFYQLLQMVVGSVDEVGYEMMVVMY